MAKASQKAKELVDALWERPHDEAYEAVLDYFGRLEAALEWCSREVWIRGHSIDGGDFEETMLRERLVVEVPATEEERADWGVDRVFTWVWSKRARPGIEAEAEAG